MCSIVFKNKEHPRNMHTYKFQLIQEISFFSIILKEIKIFRQLLCIPETELEHESPKWYIINVKVENQQFST